MSDLNHPKVRPFTPAIGLQLGLDPTFVSFVFAEGRPECLRYWCEDVRGGWTCYVPDDIAIAYPLWSTNADQTLLLYSEIKISYGIGWHDSAEMEMISQTSQGLLADLLQKIWESEASEQEMRIAAESCGFRYLAELLALVNASVSDNFRRERWRRFVAVIDDKSAHAG